MRGQHCCELTDSHIFMCLCGVQTVTAGSEKEKEKKNRMCLGFLGSHPVLTDVLQQPARSRDRSETSSSLQVCLECGCMGFLQSV